jgi:type IV pilus assembly protein PilQ
MNPFVKFSSQQRLYLLIFSLVALMAGFAGCASHKAADVKQTDDKRITGISTRVSDDQVIVTIDGNQPLTYTAIKQVFPMGVLFHFPETALDRVTSVTTPPPNDIIGSVKATELVEEQSTTSRIFIALKTDAPYDLKPQDSALQISFPKATAGAAAAPAPITEKPLAQKPEPPAPESIKNLPSAKRLKTVTATALKNNVVVNVEADGVIRNYKSFTLNDKQPRIVIDMLGLKSPFKGEQRQAVTSPYLKQVRHFGHSDKVRLVLDVPKSSLAKFSAAPADSGLLIQVGDVTAAATQSATVAQSEPAAPAAGGQKPAVKPSTTTSAPVPVSGKAAWVNRIDFSSKEDGKSALIIGTTAPVKYDLQKAGPKRLHLKLFNARLPEYRKRALITTRFESAVDRVTPVQTAAMKGDSLFTIELREAVPYTVDQQGKTLQVNFTASSIPPKPYEDANLPEWKKVLAEAPVTSANNAEKGGMTIAAAAPAAGKKAPTAAQAQTAEEQSEALLPEKKFTGEKIAFDFYDMDIRNVFRLLKEVSGKSFAIDKNVTGKVSLRFDQPVPWDQVLDLLLKMNQLGMTMEGNIIRIATLSTLAQEDKLKQAQLKAAQQAEEQAKALEPLFTEYIPISYSNASTEVLPHIQAIITEDRGKAEVDTRNNQIIITDTAVKIKQAKKIAEKIDTVTPQVVIEARIVEANTNFSREIGFDWGTVTLGQFDVPYTSSWTAGPTVFTANNIPDTLALENTASLAFSLFKTSGTPFSIVDATLAASEVEGKTNIISSPKIVTLDNKKARIKQGFEVPYTERDSSGADTVSFKNVDLLLEVTPTVTPDNRITMTIFVTKNDVVDPTESEPALSINEAETEILIDDGDTIVIGGILKSTLTWGESGIPGLRRMGVLGWLFKYQQDLDDKNELLIFLTPRIVQLEQKHLS